MVSRKKILYSISILFSLFFVLGFLRIYDSAKNDMVSAEINAKNKLKVIIDAGHGGVDGGAVASDGTLEKNLNLEIALILNEMLKSNGIETLMIRKNDVSIHNSSAKTIRAKKASDIHNRFKILEDNRDSVFVSIHQNMFSDSRYSGAQVFYSPNSSQSAALAKSIQNSFSTHLQKDNERSIKKCNTDVYLIYHANSTAVLCECGFMSNKEELSKLKTLEYKKQVAFTIYLGILEYYSSLMEVS